MNNRLESYQNLTVCIKKDMLIHYIHPADISPTLTDMVYHEQNQQLYSSIAVNLADVNSSKKMIR